MSNRTFVETSPQATASTPAQTSVGAVAGVILAANQKRKGFMVVNTGTTILYLSFGSTNPTTSAYHVALQACSSSNDGKGGVYVDDAWVGVVNAIGSGGGGTAVVTEFRTGSPDWNQSGDWGLV